MQKTQAKPSQLRWMQQLVGDKASYTDVSFLRWLFLLWLPSNITMVLASSETTDLVKIAQLADKVVEVATPQVSSATILPTLIVTTFELRLPS